mmetsp:Transcript_9912/g.26175  ORF Transcript_9912/g.26175 Transcript_9912/m.26175 type:complete len:218 (+) Transcript_9912:297-950(+)
MAAAVGPRLSITGTAARLLLTAILYHLRQHGVHCSGRRYDLRHVGHLPGTPRHGYDHRPWCEVCLGHVGAVRGDHTSKLLSHLLASHYVPAHLLAHRRPDLATHLPKLLAVGANAVSHVASVAKLLAVLLPLWLPLLMPLLLLLTLRWLLEAALLRGILGRGDNLRLESSHGFFQLRLTPLELHQNAENQVELFVVLRCDVVDRLIHLLLHAINPLL